jgi:hypothetical protein
MNYGHDHEVPPTDAKTLCPLFTVSEPRPGAGFTHGNQVLSNVFGKYVEGIDVKFPENNSSE